MTLCRRAYRWVVILAIHPPTVYFRERLWLDVIMSALRSMQEPQAIRPRIVGDNFHNLNEHNFADIWTWYRFKQENISWSQHLSQAYVLAPKLVSTLFIWKTVSTRLSTPKLSNYMVPSPYCPYWKLLAIELIRCCCKILPSAPRCKRSGGYTKTH